MLCAHCEKNEATVHIKKLDDHQIRELRLCTDCARTLKEETDAGPIGSPILSLLSALGLQPNTSTRRKLECGNCGLPYSEFKTTGLLGCSACYTSFSQPLEEILNEIHGNTRHTGKKPPQSHQAEIACLKKELQKSIADEDFEAAARIRDRIKTLEDGPACS